MSRDDVRREVRRAVDSTGRTRKQFALDAGVDAKTLNAFLSGERWPHGPTRTRVEAALGWAPGRMTDLEAADLTADDHAGLSVEDAILADDSLGPEVKQSLLSLVRLLRRIETPTGATRLPARRVSAAMEAELDAANATTPTEPEPKSPKGSARWRGQPGSAGGSR